MVYAHPFELAFGLALIINGFRTILTGQTAPSIDDSLPELFILLYRLLSMGAGVCIVAGVFIAGHPTTRPQGRTIERVGLWLAAGSYGSYAFVLAVTYGNTSGTNITILACIAVACIIRERAIRRTDVAILRALRATSDELDEGEE